MKLSAPSRALSALTAIPSLDEIERDPGCARALPTDAIAALIAKCSAVQGTLASVLLTTKNDNQKSEADPHERMLSPEEAASILRRKRRWIYRNAHRLQFVRRVSPKSLLCSEPGVYKWLALQKA
jgi:hypothetical protein